MKSYIIKILFLAIAILIQSCGNEKDQIEPEAEEEHHHDEHENTVTLTSEQMKSIGLDLGTLEKKQLTTSIKANGILKVPNQNRANVTSLMGGVVNSILVQTGSEVRRGQVIATITNNEFITLQEEFLSTTSKLDYASLEYERQKTLNEGNAAALKALQQAEAELKSLRAKKSSLKKQLEMIGIETDNLSDDNIRSRISVVSPISGSVSNVLANIGSYVETSNPIAEIVDNSQLHLDLYVYEKDLDKLRVGQTIHFTLTNNPGFEYDAKIFGISNTFESNTKAVAVHARVEGDKTNLIDGMSVTALISLEEATVDAVPTEAIVNSEGLDFIFIVDDHGNETEDHNDKDHNDKEHNEQKEGDEHEKQDEHKEHSPGEVTFKKVPVKKGTTELGYSEITLLEEIPVDAKIVIRGAFFILAKMVNTGEHEH